MNIRHSHVGNNWNNVANKKTNRPSDSFRNFFPKMLCLFSWGNPVILFTNAIVTHQQDVIATHQPGGWLNIFVDTICQEVAYLFLKTLIFRFLLYSFIISSPFSFLLRQTLGNLLRSRSCASCTLESLTHNWTSVLLNLLSSHYSELLRETMYNLNGYST